MQTTFFTAKLEVFSPLVKRNANAPKEALLPCDISFSQKNLSLLRKISFRIKPLAF
jgi:hypothetical protein